MMHPEPAIVPRSPFPLLSIAFLPPLSYLALILHYGGAIIEAHENYGKQSYRNRVRILSAQGVKDISIPIRHAANPKIPIREVSCDDFQPWRRNLWRTIQAGYGASPYFLYYKDSLEAIIHKGSNKLFELNISTLDWALKCVKAKVEIRLSESYLAEAAGNDLRSYFHPKRISPPNPSYYQPFGDRIEFIAGLSCLDLIFNLGPDASAYLKEWGEELSSIIRDREF